MKNIGIGVAVLMAVMLLLAGQAYAAGVQNIAIVSVGADGVSGMSTTIIGDVAGSNPYHNVEINIRLDQSPPANMVYEGWLIDKNNNYETSIGVFSGNHLTVRRSMVYITTSAPYDRIAVSLEPSNKTGRESTRIVGHGMRPGTTVAAADFSTMAVLPDDEAFQQAAIGARFNLTSSQFASLRMQGFGYSDIALIGSAAAKCGRPSDDVAMQLSQGQTWTEVANSCGLTPDMILQPTPAQAVAGSVQEQSTIPAADLAFLAEPMPTINKSPVPVINSPMVYMRYYNGRPVIDMQTWRFYRKAGYSWKDVAVAANIAAQTSEDTGYLLRMVKDTSATWDELCWERGLTPRIMKNVSQWPFSKSGAEEIPAG